MEASLVSAWPVPPFLLFRIPDALFALFPFVVLVGLMLKGWSAARAAAVAVALALVIAWSPAFGDELAAGDTRSYATAGSLAEAAFTALTILWIVFGALCLYHLQNISGGFETIRDRLAGLTSDPRLVAILIAWFFAMFMEGAAGFGTPVALAAPLLVGLGFRPIEAVAIALLGHAVAVSFGAVGTPVIPQVAMTGLTELSISRATSLLHGLLGWFMVLTVVFLAGRAAGQRGSPRVWAWAVIAGVAFVVPYLLIAWLVGPELPSLLGAAIGGGVVVLLLRRLGSGEGPLAVGDPEPSVRVQPSKESSRNPGEPPPGLLRSGAPYLVLIVLVLLTRLVPPVEDAARAIELSWTFGDRFAGSFEPLYHPGTLLMAAFVISGPIQRQRPEVFREAVWKAARQLAPVSIALLGTLTLARLMVHSEMIETLAVAAADNLGVLWPLAAPFVGVLGTFATGSATASNILFTEFQASTADQLDLRLETMVGAQGFGAAAGNVIAPHNIIAGSATVGLKGQEGPILRRTAIPCLIYAAMGGALTFALTRLL